MARMALVTSAPVKFEIAKLVHHLEAHVLTLPIETQSPAFGGWSVLSSDGSYTDGWHKGHLVYAQDSEEKSRILRESLGYGSRIYNQPTEICHSYLKTVINQIQNLSFSPTRARIIRLTKGMESIWHRDAPSEIPFYRLHIPILTNPKCLFVWEEKKLHLEANGSAYIVCVNKMHKVVNHGDSDRFHLVMDIEWPTSTDR